MKGIILGGGLGKRLQPLTDPLNKHLLPVYNLPMIVHVIKTLTHGGISDIMLLLNGNHPGLFLEMLEDGSSLECELSYRYTKDVGGPGRTLLLAERWINDENFVVILGDSLFFVPLEFCGKSVPHMFIMPLDDFDDPQKYGQVTVNDSCVLAIRWKPIDSFSNLIQTTCFILPPDSFSRLRKLDKISAGEVSITSLAQQYIEEGNVGYALLPSRSYIDCGTIEALHRASIQIKDAQNNL